MAGWDWLNNLYDWIGGSTYKEYKTNSREYREREAKKRYYKEEKWRSQAKKTSNSSSSSKKSSSGYSSKSTKSSSSSSGSGGSGSSAGTGSSGSTTSNAVVEDVTGNSIKSQKLEPIDNKANKYTPKWEDDNDGWKESTSRPKVQIYISYEKYQENSDQEKTSEV